MTQNAVTSGEELRIERTPVDSGVVACDVVCREEISYAAIVNAISVVKSIRVSCRTARPLDGVVVRAQLLPHWSGITTKQFERVMPDDAALIANPEFWFSMPAFLEANERDEGELWVEVFVQGVVEYRQQYPISVLPHNQWSPAGFPELVAAFVLPNHNGVANIVAKAKVFLASWSGDAAFDGYQSGDRQRVWLQAAAIYSAIQELGVTYIGVPASFEREGQKVRPPDQVFRERSGTCLDIALLYAACLEHVGLAPLLVFQRRHAFAGVWLEEGPLGPTVLDDSAILRNLSQLGRVAFVDSSATVATPRLGIDDAKRRADDLLVSDENFVYCIDLSAARADKIRPLPSRVFAGVTSADVANEPVPPPQLKVAAPRTRTTVAEERIGSGTSMPLATGAQARLDRWKQGLLDLTYRNPLLHLRETQYTRVLSHDLAQLEDRLSDNQKLRLFPFPKPLSPDDPRTADLINARGSAGLAEELVAEGLARKRLYTGHHDSGKLGHAARLIKLHRRARESVEESGVNTLFLSLGVIRYVEAEGSEVQRLAPLLLLPVTLLRKSASDEFELKLLDDEPVFNVSLAQKLLREHGIDLTALAQHLPQDDAGVDVNAVLIGVRQAVAHVPKTEVLDHAYLGHFAFTKFLLWRDLEENGEAFLASPHVGRLAGVASADDDAASGITPEDQLDTAFRPSELACPLDADSSQLMAISAMQRGKTFVLQGPPGTGKSQTITNMIARALALGKTVLFVAEKRAALDVVQSRLAALGLSPFLLELHSHKANKKAVLEQLGQALDARQAAAIHSLDEAAARLERTRRPLNDYVQRLHTPDEHGFTLFRCMSELGRLRSVPEMRIPGMEQSLSSERLSEHIQLVAEFGARAAGVAPIAAHPWRHCALTQLPNADSGAEALDDTARALDRCDQALAAMLTVIPGQSPPSSKDELDRFVSAVGAVGSAPSIGPGAFSNPDAGRRLLALVRERDRYRAQLMDRYSDRLFEPAVLMLRSKFAQWASSFWLFSFFALWGARRTIRTLTLQSVLPSAREIALDLELATTVQEHTSRIEAAGAAATSIFDRVVLDAANAAELEAALDWAATFQEEHGTALPNDAASGFVRIIRSQGLGQACGIDRSRCRELTAAWERLAASTKRLTETFALDATGLQDLFGGGPYLAAVRERVAAWRAQPAGSLRKWVQYRRVRGQMVERGLVAIVDGIEGGRLPIGALERVAERAFYAGWIRRSPDAAEVAEDFVGHEHETRIAAFVKADEEFQAQVPRHLATKLMSRVPDAKAAVASPESDLGKLLRERQKQRKHMSVRRLCTEMSSLLPLLKPCMLMSPLSVAQFLDASRTKFDLVIFDEASQIPLHDAIGALARGNQAIVVGDSKQLPPTSFFSPQDMSAADSDEDAPYEELESVLDEAIVSAFPEIYLRWHYRSRHESLIAFSNHHYYENRLLTFPGADDRRGALGISFKFVAGVYDRSKSRTNVEEARALVADVLRRFRDPTESGRSVGIVTFSKVQQELVEDLLDDARRQNPDLEALFAEGRREPLFVKNLENVQGDERDVILFSVCYGPDLAGKVALRFGPLNASGGHRRLNVAITRARQQLVVFSSMRGDQIDTSRTQSRGVADLREFLDYAEHGPKSLARAVSVGADWEAESPFEKDVHDRLVARGWILKGQVGCSGFRIDLAVVDPKRPGRFLLGIECDGASYHSAKTARDRDKLRAEVLRGLGWKLHRIWSTDFWQDPDREIERVDAILRELEGRAVGASSSA